MINWRPVQDLYREAIVNADDDYLVLADGSFRCWLMIYKRLLLSVQHDGIAAELGSTLNKKDRN